MPGMKNTLAEFSAGKLHSGSKSGPVVKNRKQAIAIGLSQAKHAKKPPAKSKRKRTLAQARMPEYRKLRDAADKKRQS